MKRMRITHRNLTRRISRRVCRGLSVVMTACLLSGNLAYVTMAAEPAADAVPYEALMLDSGTSDAALYGLSGKSTCTSKADTPSAPEDTPVEYYEEDASASVLELPADEDSPDPGQEDTKTVSEPETPGDWSADAGSEKGNVTENAETGDDRNTPDDADHQETKIAGLESGDDSEEGAEEKGPSDAEEEEIESSDVVDLRDLTGLDHEQGTATPYDDETESEVINLTDDSTIEGSTTEDYTAEDSIAEPNNTENLLLEATMEDALPKATDGAVDSGEEHVFEESITGTGNTREVTYSCTDCGNGYTLRLDVDGSDCAAAITSGTVSSISIPETIAGYTIVGWKKGWSNFGDAIPIEELYLPETLRYIDSEAFAYYSSLKEITIPIGVEQIESRAFLECSNLEKVTIEAAITLLEMEVFRDCKGLTEISLPESLEHIGSGTFNGCAALEDITLPQNITIIDRIAFADCGALKEIRIPAGVTYLSAGVFSGCTNLEKVELPDSLRLINWGAFRDCESLPEILLPDALEEIGEEAFMNDLS